MTELRTSAGANIDKRGKLVGIELKLSCGKTRKIVTRSSSICSLWIDEVQHDIATFITGEDLAFKVTSRLSSEEIASTAVSDCTQWQRLKSGSTVEAIRLFDASNENLQENEASVLTASVDGSFRTCGSCGGQTWCVTNGCVLCGNRWICDKIKAPW